MSQGDHKDDGTCIFSYKVGGQLVFPKDKDNISEKNLYSELQQTFICTRCMPKLYVILIRKKKCFITQLLCNPFWISCLLHMVQQIIFALLHVVNKENPQWIVKQQL